MSKIYADNLARSSSGSSRGISRRGVTMRAMGWDLSTTKLPYCNTFGLYKKDCVDLKTVRQQDQRRKPRQHKKRGGHQPHQPKPGGKQQQKGGRQMGCSYHKTTTHSDAECRARPENLAQQQRPSSKPVLRVFLGSAARGIFLCKTTPTRSPVILGQRGPA